MYNNLKTLLLLFFFLLSLSTFSQVEITLLNKNNIQNVQQLWNFEIEHKELNDITGSFQMKVSDENEVIYDARSTTISFSSGIELVNLGKLSPLNVTIDETIGGNLPPNVLNIELRFIQQGSFKNIGYLNIDIHPKSQSNVINLEQNENKKQSKPSKKIIEFSGNGNIQSQMATRQGDRSSVPRNYLRTELAPTLTVADIPIGLYAFYSTESNVHMQSMNQISLRFDPHQFQRNLEDKLQDKIKTVSKFGTPEELDKLNLYESEIVNKKYPKLDEWKAEIARAGVEEKLKQVKSLDGIKQVLNNPEMNSRLEELASLKKKYGLSDDVNLEELNGEVDQKTIQKLRQLLAFKEEYDKLFERKEKLEKIAKEVKKYQSLAKKIEKAESFNVEKFRGDSKNLKKGLNDFDLMTGATKFFSGIRALSIGKSFLHYSPLTINGLALNGFSLEWNPGNFYIATAIGESASETRDTSSGILRYTFKQNTKALKIGIGKPETSHLYFTGAHIIDQAKTSFQDPVTGIFFYPSENYLFGSDFKISLAKKKVIFGGEIVGSLLTKDISSDVNLFQSEVDDFPLPKFINEDFNESSSLGYAAKLFFESMFGNDNTRIRGHIQQIGPGFYSLGAPTLIKNTTRWRGEIKQKLFANKFQATLYADHRDNNVEPLVNVYQSEIISYGASVMMRLPKLPYLLARYAPYHQENQSTFGNNPIVQSNSQMLNIQLGHNYQFSKKVGGSTQIGFTYQDFDSDISITNYQTKIYSANQTIFFTGMAINLGFTYSPNQLILNQNSQLTTIDFSGSYTFFQKWNNRLGFQYYRQKEIDERIAFVWISTYPVTPNINADFRVHKNKYDNPSNVLGFDEWVAWLGFTFNW